MEERATDPEEWLPGPRGWSTPVFLSINAVDSLLAHRTWCAKSKKREKLIDFFPRRNVLKKLKIII